jgi:hypothetical protein
MAMKFAPVTRVDQNPSALNHMVLIFTKPGFTAPPEKKKPLRLPNAAAVANTRGIRQPIGMQRIEK